MAWRHVEVAGNLSPKTERCRKSVCHTYGYLLQSAILYKSAYVWVCYDHIQISKTFLAPLI